MAIKTETIEQLEQSIDDSLRKILNTYFNTKYRLVKDDAFYSIINKKTGELVYGGILLKSVAKSVTYCLVTGNDLYLRQLLLIDSKYQKLLSEYSISKYCNESKASVHHRNKMNECAHKMLSLKKSLSLRIYLILNNPAAFS